MRTYTVREDSSIDLLHSRFRDHTTALFRKHGITIIGYWQPVAKPNVLIYILAYDSLADREKKWNGFVADKERLAKFAETEKNGPLVARLTAQILRPTAYSPMQ